MNLVYSINNRIHMFQAAKSKMSTEAVVVNCQYSMATFSTGIRLFLKQ